MLANFKILALLFCLLPSLIIDCRRDKNQEKIDEIPSSEAVQEPQDTHEDTLADKASEQILCGADQVHRYLSALQNKRIGLLVNQTSRVNGRHLVDTLLALNVEVKKIFAPEHGFRGEADAGEQLADGKDPKTDLPLISLYGRKKKPSAEDLAALDMLIFDIQDVGARFYTYISTLHYVMEACAEHGVKMLVLDRPNPNGHYLDGPILRPAYQSFVGMHPVPVVHGMTVGEYARMINGEGWLKDGQKCALQVISCMNYDHRTFYKLPVRPSPNLPNMRSIYLYPSLCFFEGTKLSVGRGTPEQFQVIGHPEVEMGDYYFTPEPMPGAKYPKHQAKKCRGIDLSDLTVEELQSRRYIDLSYLIDFYQAFPDQEQFFLKNGFFDKLAGSSALQRQIREKVPAAEIRNSWQAGLDIFRQIRRKYLLYKDFE